MMNGLVLVSLLEETRSTFGAFVKKFSNFPYINV
jgi:hypothetical protein